MRLRARLPGLPVEHSTRNNWSRRSECRGFGRALDEHYEVDNEFAERLGTEYTAFYDGPPVTPFDLTFVAPAFPTPGRRIEALGWILMPNPTVSHYRRATHRHEPDYGRQLSLIGLA